MPAKKKDPLPLTTFAPKDRSTRPTTQTTQPGADIQQHLADTWRPSTKGGYSSGLKKYAEFIEATLGIPFDFGTITANRLYSFVVWAGKSSVTHVKGPKRVIKADTIQKYVHAIRTWNLVEHLTKVPDFDNEILSLLLKSTENNEADSKPAKKKTPITVRMLLDMVTRQHNK